MDFFSLYFFFMFICGLISFCMNRKHFLLMLMSLEFIVLSIFIIMYKYMLFSYMGNFSNIIFITFSVCEGVLGLSIMISLIRTHGNDYFQSFNLLC